MEFDFELFVIGGGSGGVRAARLSAGFGARVAIAEQARFGGTCVNVGCIPKKLFVYASHFAGDFRDARRYGWDVPEPRFNWPALLENKDREIARLNGVYERLLREAGVRIMTGSARLRGPHTVEIGGNTVSAERILVATGGHSHLPEFPGSEHAQSSDDMFALRTFPRRVLVIGGGYIGTEFAGIFHGLGAETSIAFRGPHLLRGFDDEVREFLAVQMAQQGIRLHAGANAEKITASGTELTVKLSSGDSVTVDLVLAATGRKPNTSGIGLQDAGVRLTPDGAIEVNDAYQSSVPSIYAIGDVTDRLNLTPVATAEGTILARNLYGGRSDRLDYENIPTSVFSHPNLGTVGLTEEEARRKFPAIDVYKSSFTPLRHTLTGSGEKTFLKMIVDRATGRVVGIHMVGADAGEIIQGMAVAMKAGATKAQFDATIGIHPTVAEEFVTMRTPAS